MSFKFMKIHNLTIFFHFFRSPPHDVFMGLTLIFLTMFVICSSSFLFITSYSPFISLLTLSPFFHYLIQHPFFFVLFYLPLVVFLFIFFNYVSLIHLVLSIFWGAAESLMPYEKSLFSLFYCPFLTSMETSRVIPTTSI